MERNLLFLYAESPVHPGAGEGTGDLDLPVQREAGTRLPVIWGQSLKGALRDHARGAWGGREPALERIFGSAPPGAGSDDDGDHTGDAGDSDGGGDAGGERGTAAGRARRQEALKPGSLAVGDAQLVAFPAPTLERTFAWATSPLALGRLRRKARLAGAPALPDTPAGVNDTTCATTTAAPWNGKLVLGPYVLDSTADQAVDHWGRRLARDGLPRADGGDVDDDFAFFRAKLGNDLVVTPDDLLGRLSRECSEITPRVQLREDSKTVKHGPFQVEFLPTETILVALLDCRDADDLGRLRELLDGTVLRVGGEETVGKGLMWCRFARSEGRRDGEARQ